MQMKPMSSYRATRFVTDQHKKQEACSAMSTTQIVWNNLPASSLYPNGQLRRDWDRLNASRGSLPFLTADAIVSALTILGDGRERLLVGYQGEEVCAMFVLSPVGVMRWQTFQPSQVPLGVWVAKSHFQLQDIAGSLLRGPLGYCIVLSITQVDPQSASCVEDTPDRQRQAYIDTAWVDIQGSFEEYWSARGKNLRQNMRKQRNKLLADGVKLTMQVLRGHDDMAPAIVEYGALESAGWKSERGTAVNSQNAQGRYYRELLEQASLRGEAVIYQLLFDQKVVAMNLCLVSGTTLVVLKTTYDESIKSYSPAFLLQESELQHVFSEGKIRKLEYYGRIMDWHTKWTNNRRTLYHLTLYRWALAKRISEARKRKAGLHSRALIVANDDETIQ
jgi:CelD/BcsL family acetyltransferase involved in cellulose biosynthesis